MGTCTALALEFIEHFLKQDVSRGTIESRLATSALRVRTSNLHLRTTQAVMNTITIRPNFRETSCHSEKVEALLTFNNLKLVRTFQGIDWDREDKEVLEERIKQFPKGIFFIRAIYPSFECKGRGLRALSGSHQSNSNTFYLFEPNEGVYEMDGLATQNSRELSHILIKAHKEWTIPHMTFYQVALSSVTENS